LYGFFLLSDKERELGEAQAEIRALRLSERAREKAVEEVIPNCFRTLSCYHVYCIVFNHTFSIFGMPIAFGLHPQVMLIVGGSQLLWTYELDLTVLRTEKKI
jgi:hypothetical protein